MKLSHKAAAGSQIQFAWIRFGFKAVANNMGWPRRLIGSDYGNTAKSGTPRENIFFK